jgi:cytochrome c peroxidase
VRQLKIISFSLIALSLIVSFAFAAGDVEKGKALFNDPKLGTNGSTCGTCHPDGKGLEKSGAMDKKEWTTPGGVTKSLEDAINVCVTMALKGKALDKNSQEMQDLVAYIKSLGEKAPMKHKAPGY